MKIDTDPHPYQNITDPQPCFKVSNNLLQLQKHQQSPSDPDIGGGANCSTLHTVRSVISPGDGNLYRAFHCLGGQQGPDRWTFLVHGQLGHSEIISCFVEIFMKFIVYP